MSTIGSNPATSGTAQQDRAASSNSHQARRQSGDNQAFANLLMAAAEDQGNSQLSRSRKNSRETAQADEDPPVAASGPLTTAVPPVTSEPSVPATPTAPSTKDDSDSPSIALRNAQGMGTAQREDGRDADHEQAPEWVAERGDKPSTPMGRGRGLAVAHQAKDAASLGRNFSDFVRGALTPSANASTSANGPLAAESGALRLPASAQELPRGNWVAEAVDDALELSDDVTALTSAIMDRLGGRGGTASSVQETGAVNADGGGPQFESPSAPTEAPADAGAWQNAWSDAVDQMSQQVSYWLGKGVSQAQLSVPGAGGDTIEVRVQLRDGEAHLEFLAGDDATRQNIVEHGVELLREALADRGIDLGSLSVDARDSGAAGQERQGREAPAEQALRPLAQSDVPRAAEAPMVRLQTHAGLDIYA